jgi:hypothetical protein
MALRRRPICIICPLLQGGINQRLPFPEPTLNVGLNAFLNSRIVQGMPGFAE